MRALWQLSLAFLLLTTKTVAQSDTGNLFVASIKTDCFLQLDSIPNFTVKRTVPEKLDCVNTVSTGFFDDDQLIFVAVRFSSSTALDVALVTVNKELPPVHLQFQSVQYGPILGDTGCSFQKENLAVGVQEGTLLVAVVCGDDWGFVRSALDFEHKELQPPSGIAFRTPHRSSNGRLERLQFGPSVPERPVRLYRWLVQEDNKILDVKISLLHDLDRMHPFFQTCDVSCPTSMYPYYYVAKGKSDSDDLTLFFAFGNSNFALPKLAVPKIGSKTEGENAFSFSNVSPGGDFPKHHEEVPLSVTVFGALPQAANVHWSVSTQPTPRLVHPVRSENTSAQCKLQAQEFCSNIEDDEDDDDDLLKIIFFVVVSVEAFVVLVLAVIVAVLCVLRRRKGKRAGKTEASKSDEDEKGKESRRKGAKTPNKKKKGGNSLSSKKSGGKTPDKSESRSPSKDESKKNKKKAKGKGKK